MINTYLPFFALLLAVAALGLRRARQDNASGETTSVSSFRAYVPALIGGIALSALGWVASASFAKSWINLAPFSWGFGLGAILAALVATLGSSQSDEKSNFATPVAFAAFFASTSIWLEKAQAMPWLFGMAAGCSLLTLIMGFEHGRLAWPPVAASVLSATACVEFLSKGLSTTRPIHPGFLFAVLLAFALVVEYGVEPFFQSGRSKQHTWIRGALATVLAMGGAFLIGQRYIFFNAFWHVVGLALIASWLVHFLLIEEGETPSWKLGLSVAIWIGVATFAFGTLRSFGMASALLAGVVAFLALGNVRSLATLGPLLALVLLRVFRESDRILFTSVDIGQQYTVFGIVLGCVALMAALDWRRQNELRATNVFAAAVLVAVLLLLFPAITAIFSGPKGLSGLLIGFGLAALWDRNKLVSAPSGIALAGGLGLALAASLKWLDPILELTRSEKTKAAWIIAVVLLVTIGAIALLTQRKAKASA